MDVQDVYYLFKVFVKSKYNRSQEYNLCFLDCFAKVLNIWGPNEYNVINFEPNGIGSKLKISKKKKKKFN